MQPNIQFLNITRSKKVTFLSYSLDTPDIIWAQFIKLIYNLNVTVGMTKIKLNTFIRSDTPPQ